MWGGGGSDSGGGVCACSCLCVCGGGGEGQRDTLRWLLRDSHHDHHPSPRAADPVHRKQQRLGVDEPKHNGEHVGWERVNRGSWGLIRRSARHFPLLRDSLRCSTTRVDQCTKPCCSDASGARCVHRARVHLDSSRAKRGTFGRSRSLQSLALCLVATTTTTLCPVHLTALVRAVPNLRLASATNKQTNKRKGRGSGWSRKAHLHHDDSDWKGVGVGCGVEWGPYVCWGGAQSACSPTKSLCMRRVMQDFRTLFVVQFEGSPS
jgi:hypothetical protein